VRKRFQRWRMNNRAELLLCVLAIALAALWAYSGEQSLSDMRRHVYGVNALVAVWWGGLTDGVEGAWISVRRVGAPGSAPRDVATLFVRQAFWTTTLWVSTSALLLGSWVFLVEWATWIVLLATLLGLGGMPMILEAQVGLRRSRFIALATGGSIAAAILGLSQRMAGSTIVTWWEATSSKLVVSAVLLGLYVGGVWVSCSQRARVGKTS